MRAIRVTLGFASSASNIRTTPYKLRFAISSEYFEMTVINASRNERNYGYSNVSYYYFSALGTSSARSLSVAEKRKKSPKPPSFIQKECRATKVERAPRVKSQTFLSRECARADLRGGCAPETSTGRNYTQ